MEAGVEVGVELQLASKGRSTFGWAHASDGKSAEGVLVAEGHEVGRVGAEESHNNVACDAPFVLVGPTEHPGEAAGKTRVGRVALERGGQLRLPVAGNDCVHNTLESGVCCSEGGELPEEGLQDRWVHRKDLV